MAMVDGAAALFHTSFSKMYDNDGDDYEGDDHACAVTIIQSSVKTGHNALTRPTEAIFDTGATGSIITNRAPLSDVSFISSTIFRGLAGDTGRDRQSVLQPICRDVHHIGVRMCQ